MSDGLPVFELKMREGAIGPMTGGNAELYVDGKKLSMVKSVTINVEAGGMATISLEMYGTVNVIGSYESQQVVVKQVALKAVE